MLSRLRWLIFTYLSTSGQMTLEVSEHMKKVLLAPTHIMNYPGVLTTSLKLASTPEKGVSRLLDQLPPAKITWY